MHLTLDACLQCHSTLIKTHSSKSHKVLANKNAKEKEKKNTTLAIYHGALLVTMGDFYRAVYFYETKY